VKAAFTGRAFLHDSGQMALEAVEIYCGTGQAAHLLAKGEVQPLGPSVGCSWDQDAPLHRILHRQTGCLWVELLNFGLDWVFK